MKRAVDKDSVFHDSCQGSNVVYPEKGTDYLSSHNEYHEVHVYKVYPIEPFFTQFELRINKCFVEKRQSKFIVVMFRSVIENFIFNFKVIIKRQELTSLIVQ